MELDHKLENSEVKPDLKALGELSQDAKQIQGETGFMKPGQKVKGKPGRKPMSPEEKAKKAEEQKLKAENKQKSFTDQPQSQSQQPQSEPLISSKQIAKPVAQFVSTLAVNYVKDPRAGMTPDELENLSMAMGLLMDKYMPLVMNQYGAEAMFCIVLGQYGMRVMAMKKVLDMEREQKFQDMLRPDLEPISPSQAPIRKPETVRNETINLDTFEQPGFNQ